jgi:hypothetical protein
MRILTAVGLTILLAAPAMAKPSDVYRPSRERADGAKSAGKNERSRSERNTKGERGARSERGPSPDASRDGRPDSR